MAKKKKTIQCRHCNGEESGYHYDIGEEDLWLCDQCNLNLAGEMMQQLAIEVFARKMFDDLEMEVKNEKK